MPMSTQAFECVAQNSVRFERKIISTLDDSSRQLIHVCIQLYIGTQRTHWYRQSASDWCRKKGEEIEGRLAKADIQCINNNNNNHHNEMSKRQNNNNNEQATDVVVGDDVHDGGDDEENYLKMEWNARNWKDKHETRRNRKQFERN